MGANFYFNEMHLGKRSAAGLFCYDCGISLITGLPGGYDSASPHSGNSLRLSQCPACNRGREVEGFYNPELFKPTPEQTALQEQSPVRYAYSFSFAEPPEKIGAYPATLTVRDEYDDEMPMGEFRKMVEGACFLFTDTVGRDFS